MTINTKLEFDGGLPNNARLQHVLDQLAASISSLNGGSIGSPLTIVGPANNMVLSGSGTGQPVTISMTGSDPDPTFGINVSANASPVGFIVGDVAGGIAFAPFAMTSFYIVDAVNQITVDCEAQVAANTGGVALQANVNTFSSSAKTDAMWGGLFAAQNNGSGNISGTFASDSGFAGLTVATSNYNATATITDAAALFVRYGAGTHPERITNDYGIYAAERTGSTNNYAFWYDSRGVYRIKGDGIAAHYNPSFTKYTPGAANFERLVFGQWIANVAQITTEAGGTGTLRGMQLGATTATPLGFYGKTPIACAVLATGAAHTVDDVITALQNLGLVKQS